MGNWVKKVKGLRSTDWQLENSHGDVKVQRRNIVGNTVITTDGVRWVLEIPGGHAIKYVII